MFKLQRMLAVGWLLIAAVGAAPAADPAIPAVVFGRQGSCPSALGFPTYDYTTVNLATTTVTYGWSSLGHVTSTKTESYHDTITTISTIYSPAVTTEPATTVTSYGSTVTSTFIYEIITETTTLAGYAPSSLCSVTTYIIPNPSTTSVTVTNDLTFATVYTSEIGHVTTTTLVDYTTTTRLWTTPGSTAYATTVTDVATSTYEWWTLPTVWVTAYEKGCEKYACQG